MDWENKISKLAVIITLLLSYSLAGCKANGNAEGVETGASLEAALPEGDDPEDSGEGESSEGSSDIDFSSDPNNCGSLGNVCNLAHAVSGCVAGGCVVKSCDDEWQDYDGKDFTGCEQYFPNLKRGHILVTEVLPKAQAVSDDQGEFLEFYNTTNNYVNLKDMTVRMAESGEAFTITGNLVVAPNAYAVLGASDSADVFEEVHGILEKSLRDAGETISIHYKSVEVDSVSYSDSSYVAGVSIQLDKSYFNVDDNDLASNWCDSAVQFQSGDFGTPGRDNSICN